MSLSLYNGKMSFRLLSALFSVLLLTSGCSDSPVGQEGELPSTDALNQQQQERYEKTAKPVFVNWHQLDDSLPKFLLACEDCPPSFGQVISQTTTVDPESTKPKNIITTGNCQGGLIGKDLFLTSRHCLPEDLKEVGKDCTDRIKVILPEISSDYPLQVLECEKIEFISDEYPDLPMKTPQPDWAIIKLKNEVEGRISEIDKEGIPDKEKLFSYIPLLNPETDEIKIKKITCEAIQGSMQLPEFLENKSPIALLECDHDITRGFSGSLLYRSDKQDGKPVAALSHIWDAQINKEDILVSQSIVASNLSCLTNSDDEPLPSCGFKPGAGKRIKEKMILDALEIKRNEINDELKDFLANNKNPVQWESTTNDNLNDLPENYGQFLKQLTEMENPYLSKNNIKVYFQTLVPIFAQCLKKDSVPDHTQDKKMFTEVPVISLSVFTTTRRQVRVRYKIKFRKMKISPRRDHPGQYVFYSKKSLKERKAHKRRIMSDRFNHASTGLSICP